MPQPGSTPIIIYNSSTASQVPLAANLSQGELAINVTDKKLYSKDSGGNVILIASNGGDVTGPATSTNLAIPTFSGTGGKTLLNNSGVTISSGVVSGTGFTGALNGSLGATTPSTAVVTSLTDSGLTSGRVTYASTGGLLADSANLTFNGSSLGVIGNVLATGGSATVQARLNGSDSFGGGASLGITNTAADRIWFTQLSASNNYDWWYFNGSAASKLMTLDASGNVGVGVSPTVKLDVNGSARLIGTSTSSVSLGFGPQDGVTGWSIGNGIIDNTHTFRVYDNTAGTTRMTIDSSGNVGLGVTPSASTRKTIQIYDTTQPSITFSAGTVNNGGSIYTNMYYDGSSKYIGTGYASAMQTNSGGFQWYTAPSGTAGNAVTLTQAMTLDASGNLSVAGTIGTSSTIKRSANGGGSVQVQNLTSTAGQAAGFKTLVQSSNWGANGSDFITTLVNATTGSTDTEIRTFSESIGGQVTGLKIRSSTNIVTMPAYGAGAATFSAAGVISSVSDETWKTKDGVPLNPDAMLQKLEPGYWYYNEEKAPIFGADRQLGFYAQNVNYAIGAEAAPIPEEGKPWGYYDRSVLAVTVMSLQKALATIENLTARLEVLEAK